MKPLIFKDSHSYIITKIKRKSSKTIQQESSFFELYCSFTWDISVVDNLGRSSWIRAQLKALGE